MWARRTLRTLLQPQAWVHPRATFPVMGLQPLDFFRRGVTNRPDQAQDRTKHIDRVQRILEKPNLTKKMKRKLQSELHFLQLTDRIETTKDQKASTPHAPKADGTDAFSAFQAPPFDPAILRYIKKHQLHRSKNLPEIRQSVNSFVDEVTLGTSLILPISFLIINEFVDIWFAGGSCSCVQVRGPISCLSWGGASCWSGIDRTIKRWQILYFRGTSPSLAYFKGAKNLPCSRTNTSDSLHSNAQPDFGRSSWVCR